MGTLLTLVGLNNIKGIIVGSLFLTSTFIASCINVNRPINEYEKRELYNLLTDKLKEDK